MIGGYVSKKIISQHIFMFPFRFTGEVKKINDSLIGNRWQLVPFTFQDGGDEASLKYNEFIYFHQYVRKSIFYLNKESSFLEYFEKQLSQKAEIAFHIQERHYENGECVIDKNGKIYTLKIKKISLHIFKTDVGILALELSNENSKENWAEEFNDILLINDFGRRIYPQFIGNPKEVKECERGTQATKGAFLCDKIELRIDDKEIVEEFDTESYLGKDSENEVKFAKYINELLKPLCNGSNNEKIFPLIDDRMFTICWYGSNPLSQLLTERKADDRYAYEISDEWYKYVYIDGKNIGVANEKMKRDLIKNATYQRWAEYGTLFGISRYSLVAITDRSKFSYDFLREHMRGVYYEMAILLLAQRASIVAFMDKVSEISKDLEKEKNYSSEKHYSKIRDLFFSLIVFESRLHFAEITPQEQGIEMYNMAYRIMGIDELSEDLKYEIEKLHNFVDLQNSKENSKTLGEIQKFTWFLSALGVSISVINVILQGMFKIHNLLILNAVFAVIVVIFAIIYFHPFQKRR